jgi:hypothetical protein
MDASSIRDLEKAIERLNSRLTGVEKENGQFARRIIRLEDEVRELRLSHNPGEPIPEEDLDTIHRAPSAAATATLEPLDEETRRNLLDPNVRLTVKKFLP